MCGIAGIVDLEGRREIDRLALERMTEALEHRGPDGHGYHLEPGLGFGHRRLAIIDEAGGRQPYTASGGTVICYNGEIYNHREVREDLTRAGRQFRTRSDTEVLAELMDLRGPEGLPELQGMFAFAAWDPRNETLTLARDRLGEKPLYTYITRDGFLVFASEIDAMLAGGLVTPVIDSTSVADYLFYGYVPDPKTIYRGIRKLPPAHELTIRRGRDVPPPRRWWSLRMKPDQGCRFEAALETMLPTLDEAVSDQMISDRPIAAFLSGGVDSSAVTSSMQIGQEAKVTTCAMGFDDPAYDERGPAAEVARHLGTDHREFVTHFDPAFLIPAVAAIYGEPFADTSAVPTVLLCKGARQHSVVALSGDGGDEIFAGYGRYDGILQEARIRQFLPEVARRSVFRAAGHLYPAFPPSVPAPFRLKTALQSVSEEPEAGYARAVSAILPDRCRALLAPEMRDYEPQSIIESAMVAADISDPVLAAQAVDMMTWLPGRMLVKVDRASMASGLEVRPPLLDHRLVEWAATLPRSFKLKGPTAKRILKEALKPRLPADILARQKQGFGAPVDGWFRDDGGALIDNLMARDAWRDSGYFSPDRVRELAKRHRTGRGQHGQELWSVLMFDAFLTRQSCNRSLLDEIPSINAPSIAREAVAQSSPVAGNVGLPDVTHGGSLRHMLSRFANSAGELGLSFKPRRRNYRRPDMHDHLEPTGPKRLLALDGGGVRSAMSIAILEKIEGTLQRRHGNHDSFKLSDYFDLIGGTSTGAILASALATNAVRASELRTLYEELTRDVFRRGGQFDEKRLGQALERIFGSKTLGGEMATGLAVVARRVDTDSTLVFHNNPEGPNYDDAPEKAALGYARYPVANVIRASTAYPGEFAPAQVKLARLPHLEEGLFVDAGFTPFNNPAFQLFLLATLDNRGFGWTKGEEQLLVTSVGTGSLCNELSPGSNRRASRAKQAQRGLNFMIDGAEHTGELLMQLLSEPAVPQETIQEFGDLRDARLTPEPQCTYQRYQAKLTAKTLSDEFGLGLSTRQLNRVRNMMDRDGFQIAHEIGQAVADTLVREDHFPAAFNLEPLTAARAIKPADKAPAKEPEAEAEEAPAETARDMTASRLAKLAESPALRRSPLPTGLPRR